MTALHLHRFPIHSDVVAVRISLLAQLGHLPIDRDSPLADQFLTSATGAEASASEYLLQAFFHKCDS
jgi:hypothetical protein